MAHLHAPPDAPGSRPLRIALAAVLLPLLALALVAAALLFARPDARPLPPGLAPAADLVDATVLARVPVTCPTDEGPSVVPLPTLPEDQPSSVQETQCVQATVRLDTGREAGREVVLDVLSTPARPFPLDGGVVLAPQPAEVGSDYLFVDVQRDQPLLLLGAVFAAAVLLVGRWAGLRALVGLALSLLVISLFVLPALLAGRNAVLVALVGSALVMFGSLYLAHGVTVQTSIAVLGTLASLAIAVTLAAVLVPVTDLTGAEAGEANLLAGVVGLDLRGLLLAGIVIGSLGVLDDVTVTQAATVWELHLADPRRRTRELYAAALRVGRQHMAATVNTLALAYVGTALPLLVVFALAEVRPQDAVAREVVAQEVVRALTGSLGIVAAVPLTTALAAAAVRLDRRSA